MDNDSSATTMQDYVMGKLSDISSIGDYTLTTNTSNKTATLTATKGSDKTTATATIDEDGRVIWDEINTNPWIQTGTTVKRGDVTLAVGQAVTGYKVTVSGTEIGDGKWFVLGAKGGKLLITTNTSYEDVYFSGGDGYQNGVSILNTTVAKYNDNNFAYLVRALDVDDLNRVTEYNPETAKWGAGVICEYGNEVTFYWDGSDAPYYSYKNGENTVDGNYQGNYDIFHWFDIKTKQWKNSEKSTTASTEKKQEITKLTGTNYEYSASEKIETSDPAYTLLFANTGDYVGDPGSYWLGSPMVMLDLEGATFGFFCVSGGYIGGTNWIFDTGTEYRSDSMGCRPVVSLKSDVQITAVGAISK